MTDLKDIDMAEFEETSHAKNIDELLEIAEMHQLRIKESLEIVESMIPLTSQKVEHFTHQQRVEWEIVAHRFSKLQDLLAQSIMNKFLFIQGYTITQLSFIDKLNLLEKAGIIENSYHWRTMRKLRNYVAHEYDHIDFNKQAQFLNIVCKFLPELFLYIKRIKEIIAQMNELEK